MLLLLLSLLLSSLLILLFLLCFSKKYKKEAKQLLRDLRDGPKESNPQEDEGFHDLWAIIYADTFIHFYKKFAYFICIEILSVLTLWDSCKCILIHNLVNLFIIIIISLYITLNIHNHSGKPKSHKLERNLDMFKGRQASTHSGQKDKGKDSDTLNILMKFKKKIQAASHLTEYDSGDDEAKEDSEKDEDDEATNKDISW